MSAAVSAALVVGILLVVDLPVAGFDDHLGRATRGAARLFVGIRRTRRAFGLAECLGDRTRVVGRQKALGDDAVGVALAVVVERVGGVGVGAHGFGSVYGSKSMCSVSRHSST